MIAKHNVKTLTEPFRRREQLSIPVRLAHAENVSQFSPSLKAQIEAFFAHSHVTLNMVRLPMEEGLPFAAELFTRESSNGTGRYQEKKSLTQFLGSLVTQNYQVINRLFLFTQLKFIQAECISVILFLNFS